MPLGHSSKHQLLSNLHYIIFLAKFKFKQEKTDKRKTGFSINRVCVPDIWEHCLDTEDNLKQTLPNAASILLLTTVYFSYVVDNFLKIKWEKCSRYFYQGS